MWTAVLILHALFVAALLPFLAMQAHLLFLYLTRYGKALAKLRAAETSVAPDSAPSVTVQLPLYNERYVAERLLDSIAALDYPRDRLEIQVLDDSTDDTSEIVERRIAQLRRQHPGLDLVHLHRTDRQGFKAGALQEGLAVARGEFIAIFDADFVPASDFLHRTLTGFVDPSIGAVQARWGHLNRSFSNLTASWSFLLDAHFSVEKGGRCAGRLFTHFNGTAGVWRRACIADSGGWSADTLTEDLDLSLRAQLKGWRIVFLEDVGAPAELPAFMGAFRLQQFRWMKGTAAAGRKLLWPLLRSPLPLSKKLHAVVFLLAPLVFVFAALGGLLSIAVPFAKLSEPRVAALTHSWMAVCGLILPFQFLYLWTSWRVREENARLGIGEFLWRLAHSNLLMAGIAFHNSVAVIEGWLGFDSPFLRTPKLGVAGGEAPLGERMKYFSRLIGTFTLLEALLAMIYVGGAVAGMAVRDYGLVAFQLLTAGSLAMMVCTSIRDSLWIRRAAISEQTAAPAASTPQPATRS